ncbi:hypothetical protein [Sandaracinobacteroides saxicola]|uniref:Uncharacterized protein n=1 Tax=Sandaracinobacteroides saxicola TaxID=2759707 RepID=A0A7G5IEC0_9SPHN|nr:hypothetical protein [Sandaracinobacteroides saxicola]QMW21712.1 hypothetical protein H3309_09825 [Sandaracinobacteroides saxicola]
MTTKPANRRIRVFINCPFDAEFAPIQDAINFAVITCGFKVNSAATIEDSGQLRLAKIIDLIADSSLSIHDLSRVELDPRSNLPRFNMPLELGIALGMKYLGRRKLRDHQLLVLDSKPYRYQQSMSDIAGVDPKSHGKNPAQAIVEVRNFLAAHSAERLPGPDAISSLYTLFNAVLPSDLAPHRQKSHELTPAERLRLMESFVAGAAA